MTSRRTRTALGALAGCLLALTACGAPGPAAAPADPAPAAAPSPPGETGPPVLYAVQTGPLGIVVTDGSGRLMYRSDDDSADPPTSACTGACTETWIPVTMAQGQEPELLGVDPGDVGTVTRDDGARQLTLGGWPLYRYRDDPGTLDSTGQHGADGTWFAVTTTGEKATPA